MGAGTVSSCNKSCYITDRLDGKLAIVTGANTGIGKCTAGELARRGATVIMACRNMEKAEEAKKDLLNKYGVNNADSVKIDLACPSMSNSMTPIKEDQLLIENLDLASIDSIKQFAQRISQKFTKLDYLINNAGLIYPRYAETVDGFEMTMGVNHLGPYLLTDLLLPLLKKAAPSRIINVSSIAHKISKLKKPELLLNEKEYASFPAYCQSKLANVLHAMELSARLQGTGVIAVSLHPGSVKSEWARDMTSLNARILKTLYAPLLISPWLGSQTTLYAVLTDNPTPGAYYSNCQLKEPSKSCRDPKTREWLWNKSRELLGLQPDH